MPDGRPPARTLRIDLPIDDDELRVLRGALLAAKATELAEIHRRGYRLLTGYGTDSARAGMNDEVEQHHRRIELLERLIAALAPATPPSAET
jgi:hypothetical protein